MGLVLEAVPSIAVPERLAAQEGYSPRLRLLIWVLSIDIVIALTAAITAVIAGARPDALFAEGEPITLFSAGQLLLLSGLAAWLFMVRRQAVRETAARSIDHWLWLVMAAGALWLAADEALAIHEAVDRQLHLALNLRETPLTDRIDDLIVLGYGIVAAGVLWTCRREALRFRFAAPLVVLGFALFAGTVIFDLLTNSYGVGANRLPDRATLEFLIGLANVGEESFKLCGEGAFIAALALCAWMATLERKAARQTAAAVA